MRSHRSTFVWLLRKDAREMIASRSWWLLVLFSGVLAGHAFLTAVGTYAEMSGFSGGPAALREGLSPLDGIVAPVFSVLSLIATLLLPFVVIRLIAHERTSGAWKLLVQGPASIPLLLASKFIVLLAGWLLAWIPACAAMLMWRAAGNHLAGSELVSVMAGHALFAWLTIGIAAAAAAVASGEATAAIVTLGFTIGTWALDFIGAARGGAMALVARYTPTAVLGGYERGLVRVDASLIMLFVGAAGMIVAGVFLNLQLSRSSQVRRSALLCCFLLVAVFLATRVHRAWDLSENRRNSFSAADEAALRQIRLPLRVDVNLAAEDPRLTDLRSNVLDKLSRLLPSVTVKFVGGTGTGIFAAPGQDYGATWYQLGDRRVMTHATAEPVVLGVLYELAGIQPPAETTGGYPGYPLVRRPTHIALWFFGVWPLLIVVLLVASQRPRAVRMQHITSERVS